MPKPMQQHPRRFLRQRPAEILETKRDEVLNPFARIDMAQNLLDCSTAEKALEARLLLLPLVDLFNFFPQRCRITGMIGQSLVIERRLGEARFWLEISSGSNISRHVSRPQYKRMLADLYVELREFERAAFLYRQLLDDNKLAAE